MLNPQAKEILDRSLRMLLEEYRSRIDDAREEANAHSRAVDVALATFNEELVMKKLRLAGEAMVRARRAWEEYQLIVALVKTNSKSPQTPASSKDDLTTTKPVKH